MDVAEMDELPWDAAIIWGQARDVERLTALGEALARERAAAHKRLRDLDHRLAQVLRALALTPGRQFVEQLLHVYRTAQSTDAGTPSGARFLASLLAEAQSVEDLEPALCYTSENVFEDLRGCLFHELLLRGVRADEIHRVTGGTHFCEPWNGLSWLPDTLAEMEHGAAFPSRHYNGAASPGCSSLRSPVSLDAAARRAGAGHPMTVATTPRLAELITGPPEQGNWGAHDVGVFTTERPVTPEAFPGVVASLPMDCLEGLGEDDRFVFAPCTLKEVWHLLYETASHTAMYGPGVLGAYGRLSAWWSLAGLAGAGPEAGPAEVERQAAACTWLRFEADSEWFHNEIGNDYGIAALSPDGRRIAVLAATDTD
ncbi:MULTISPECIES: DUF6183 family protein [Streptomyces]|uniref:DUF6183 family protein n=1 Tax=Streptomyces TaxID=1883 RepID=UPI00163BB468|nr:MULTISPECIES: DUF6183 family protein [Streptomyces]MBC2874130.1 hypothetical protein [Streptomyces sp. TYQ1024]UBI40182.1 DUF6183 family protein [Streptomyces mobaraensis]UKW32760.1 DUF6183 family protein [Streptomyces sp. TYQ1024]